MHSTDERLEAAKRFIATQINAIRQDPDMSDPMFEVVRDSVINEFDRFMAYMREQGMSADYAAAYDEGYTKALEHLRSRYKGAVLPTPSPTPTEASEGVPDASQRYPLSTLVTVGQQIANIPRPAWPRVRNALRQLKFRTGREYAVIPNETTGMMRVVLVKEGTALPSRRTLANKLRMVV